MNIFCRSVSRFWKIFGLDFHILTTLLFRGWGFLASAITVVLLPIWLSPLEQGFYFTFVSVLGIQIFFELGLNQIIMQLVSHQTSYLHEDKNGQLVGHPLYLDRIASIAAMTNRWYACAAFLFALVSSISGFFFFQEKGLALEVNWLLIWIILVGATSINLWVSPNLALMEGCGKVGHVARLRLLQSIIGYVILWLALYFGAGLWIIVILPLSAAMCTFYWINYRASLLQGLRDRKYSLETKINWQRDIFPLQWRVGLSWVSGYLVFSLFTPMVFISRGAIEAGQLGIALAIFASISIVGMSWINAKVPNFVIHIARGQRKELNILFKGLLIRSTILILICSAFFLIFIQCLTYLDLSIVNRIVPLEVLTFLAITTVVNSVIFGMAAYMRAHREEPMLTQSIVVGLLTALAAYLASKYGVLPMAFVYMAITITISLPWTIMLFMQYFRRIS